MISLDSDDEDLVVITPSDSKAAPTAPKSAPQETATAAAEKSAPQGADDTTAGKVARKAPAACSQDLLGVGTDSSQKAAQKQPAAPTEQVLLDDDDDSDSKPMQKQAAASSDQVPKSPPKRVRRQKQKTDVEAVCIDLEPDVVDMKAAPKLPADTDPDIAEVVVSEKPSVPAKSPSKSSSKSAAKSPAKSGAKVTPKIRRIRMGKNAEATKKASDDSVEKVEAAEPTKPECDEDAELEKKATEMAEKALEKMPEAAKEAIMEKTKQGILKRLKHQAVEQKEKAKLAAAEKERRLAQKKAALERLKQIAIQKQQLTGPKGVMPKSSARKPGMLNVKFNTRLIAARRAGESLAISGEKQRQLEREKRKALWGSAEKKIEPDAEGKLSANSWEKSEFVSAEKKGKFLRLMGGQKLVDAAEAANANKAEEEEDDGFFMDGTNQVEELDIPSDLPTFELCGGDWKDTKHEQNQKKELARQLGQAMRQRQKPRAGLG